MNKTDTANINFHQFVDESLGNAGFRILNITEELMESRISDFMLFVNSIRIEHSESYGWSEEPVEYFLNPLNDKWKFSFCILDQEDQLCFVNFSSVYGDIIHNHCTYASKNSRGSNFAKLHIIKLCQQGLDLGFKMQEGYWPVNNNGSIILFLKMGWKIHSIRNERDLMMTANLEKVRNQTYGLLLNNK